MVALRLWVLLASLAALACAADDTSTDTSSTDSVIILTGTKETTSTKALPTSTTKTSSSSSGADTTVLSGTVITSSYITLGTTSVSYISLGTTTWVGTRSVTDNNTETANVQTVTYLTGSSTVTATITGNFSTTASSTTISAPTATNTQPCNNYVEFCERKYSNITVVGCHNSPFVRLGNVAANQEYDVTAQLNDGARFLQAQIQWPTNDTAPHFCHTTCDLFDAGPITDWLGKVKSWVASNRFEVITILLGNGNYSDPRLYYPYIESTGILDYIYTPPKEVMTYDDWPTLQELILLNTRVIMFLDYQANTTEYPWLMDEFSNVWETPFDPQDQTFPCTIDRPPGLSVEDGKNRLYLANHNLNTEVSLLGTSILIPYVTELNTTNNVSGFGSLGLAANNCRDAYDRAPNILNVDYYNYGGFPGSVFEVAARINNVTYTMPCCGTVTSAAGRAAVVLLSSMGTLCVAGAAAWILA